MTFRDGEAAVSYPIPALIEPDMLARVLAVGEDRYQIRVRPTKQHALTGVLRCANCGALLTIRNHTSADGVARVWHPPKTMREGCVSSFGHYRPIARAVLGALEGMLRDEASIEAAVREALTADTPDLHEAQAELADLRRAQKRDAVLIDQGIDTLLSVKTASVRAAAEAKVARLQEAVACRQERIDALEDQLRQSEVRPEAAQAIHDTMAKLRRGHALHQSSVEAQREVVGALFVGRGTLRPMPHAKAAPRQEGVFLRVLDEPQRVEWLARGRFFEAAGGTGWDVAPEVIKTGAAVDLPKVAGALKALPVKRAHTRAFAASRSRRCQSSSEPAGEKRSTASVIRPSTPSAIRRCATLGSLTV